MNTLEQKLNRLYSIPESNWGERRRLAQDLITKNANNLISKRMPSGGRNFIQFLFFEFENEAFVYFDDVTPTPSQPIINFFQIEKRINYGEHIYKTALVLSSDDSAQTQASGVFMALDEGKL